MKLLSICIPTYKRSETLRRCIESVSKQIEKYKLMDDVNIYVANDASPDNTTDVLLDYKSLQYFKAISRETNLGMNINIRTMFAEVKEKSEYQLIITDDDFLQPDTLNDIVEFLKDKHSDNNVSAIWTPRHGYTEDNELHTITCNPFSKSMFVRPSVTNAGKYMFNGFVLSGLIIRAKYIDYDLWKEYEENAYFPMIFFGDLLLQEGGYFWNKNIVHHTVLNECHWGSWGRNEFLIILKKFSDFVNTYAILSLKFKRKSDVVKFYIASFTSIRPNVNYMMHSDYLKGNKYEIIEAIDEQKNKGIVEFESPLRMMLFFMILLNALIGFLKLTVFRVSLIFVQNAMKKDHYRKRAVAYLSFLRTIPFMIKLIR